MAFQVINIIDGDTIRVSPNWVLGEHKGDIVRVKGYRTPKETEQGFATKKIRNLLINKLVDLKNAAKLNSDSEALLSSVFLDNVDIATYFPEYIV